MTRFAGWLLALCASAALAQAALATRGLDERPAGPSGYGKAKATTASEMVRENLPPPPAAIATY